MWHFTILGRFFYPSQGRFFSALSKFYRSGNVQVSSFRSFIFSKQNWLSVLFSGRRRNTQQV